MTRLARILMRVFFRTVELEGSDRLPKSGPVVVANHTNGLVDGLLLMATLPRYPRFLGKSTLFRIPPLWPFLKLAGVIPVHRAVDGVAGDGNASAFATGRNILAGGGMVAVFPERISRDELTLQPLKTGVARIALEGVFDDGIADVFVVAAGLTYDAKARFRSRALVRVGDPVGIAGLAECYRTDSRAAVRTLTDDLGSRLSSVSPSYASWAEAELSIRIAEIVVRSPGAQLPTDIDMARPGGGRRAPW
ncbi:MAG TPA: 1-acyl-sn-glycerol-3-phosphate acyltransferase [Acidimicrobiales bacterium]|jgi:1-acyl-sn-glycerol-3-phosphate acyltransferase